MGFEIYNNSTQYAEFIVMIIFTPLGVAVTALRFVATRRGARKLGFDDWMAGTATLFFVLFNIAALMAISILNGRTIEDEIAESPSDYRRMREWDMAGLYFYFVHILAVKLSVLALLYRIFGVKRAYRVWIYIIGGFQTGLSLVFCIVQALQCQPFDRYFDRSVPGTCKDDGLVVISGETPNSLVDFAMVILAMVMIRPRQLPSATKWKLRVLFGLGIVAGILGFVKIAVTYSMSNIYAFSMVALWTCVQMFVSLLCCCLPTLQPLLAGSTLWSRLTSRLSSFPGTRAGRGSNSRTTRGSADVASGKRHGAGASGASGGDSSSGDQRWSWDDLEQQASTSAQNLTWPPPTYQAETERHALRELPQVQYPAAQKQEAPGIHVQREFTLVESETPRHLY